MVAPKIAYQHETRTAFQENKTAKQNHQGSGVFFHVRSSTIENVLKTQFTCAIQDKNSPSLIIEIT